MGTRTWKDGTKTSRWIGRYAADALALTAPPSDAELCERAIQAIWRSLDEHALVDSEERDKLARVLEPLTALPLGDRPQRLIKTLKLPDPIDASHLYWLTRRLLTLVPELQAVANGVVRPGVN